MEPMQPREQRKIVRRAPQGEDFRRRESYRDKEREKGGYRFDEDDDYRDSGMSRCLHSINFCTMNSESIFEKFLFIALR